jgi:hypothetical protein
MYPCSYAHKEDGGGGGGGGMVDEQVRRLEGRWLTRGVENNNMTDCISSLFNTSKDDILVWYLYKYFVHVRFL